MGMDPYVQNDYTDAEVLTAQSLHAETDLNRIVARHIKAGTLEHIEQFGGQYGDISEIDYQASLDTVARANTMFAELPANVRDHFGNDPGKFLAYVEDPANVPTLVKLFPALGTETRLEEPKHPESQPPQDDGDTA